MSGAQPGPKNNNWKGGRTLASSGYYLVKRPDHPLADCRGYVYEHRLVACEKLGRLLESGELVHHLNGDKTDNRPENLEVVPSIHHHCAKHSRRRNTRKPDEPNPAVECACGCGATFAKYDDQGRPRRILNGHNVARNALGQWAPNLIS